MLPIDPALYAWLNANAQTPAVSIAVARAASAWLPLLCIAPVAWGLLLGTRAMRRSIVLVLTSMLLAWVVARLIRWGFPAPRPAQLGMGLQWIEHGLRASFPSLHATGAFAFAQALSLGCTRRRPWMTGVAWFMAASIAWSRVHLGVHFPSDVMAGALVGMASASMVWHAWLWLRRRSNRQRHGLRMGLPL
ncbi:phosphatase PAP2 family protein [Comamonas composti]|uniref:phosphatase PAP2 family protein n=1 Tax=Comamonas composti TaxID=408558 RepID=UPI00040E8EB2|nr:phosphatase PAP2 family protein [Comamonas composti]